MPQLKISLSGNRSLVATYSLSRSPSKKWLVFLQESGADFQQAQRKDLVNHLGSTLAKQFNYLVINKPGVYPRGKEAQEFESSFRRKIRIQDALQAINTLIPKDHATFIVGYSEGAYLAPQVALKDPRVRGVVMIGGGTRGWLKEELENAGPREKNELKKVIRLIYKSPRSKEIWNEFSYATWYSYRGDDTLRALRRLDLPILAILGGRDRTIDLKTTRRDLSELIHKQPLRVKIIPRCGHSFVNHWAEAWLEVRKFLSSLS